MGLGVGAGGGGFLDKCFTEAEVICQAAGARLCTPLLSSRTAAPQAFWGVFELLLPAVTKRAVVPGVVAPGVVVSPEQREAQDVFDVPTNNKRGNARKLSGGGTHVGAPGRAAPMPSRFGAERVARGGDLAAAAGAQARSRPRHRRRARSARRRWQPAAAPPADTQARSAPSARGAPCAERVARRGDQARRRRRARSAHAMGAERVARGGASWHAGAASTRWDVGGLCPARRAQLYMVRAAQASPDSVGFG